MMVLGVLCLLLLQDSLAQSSPKSIIQASNEFSLKAYKLMSKTPGNLLFCPVSAHVALGLLHQGAGGNTAQEIATALGLTSSNADIKQGYKSLLAGLQQNVTKMVTKLYLKEGYELDETFTSMAREVFRSDVETVQYSDPKSAANTINQYVEENTDNKIKNFIDDQSIDDNTRLIMVNAVHFAALWKNSFDAVYDSKFRISSSETKPIKMMMTSGYFYYKELEDLNSKALLMDYKGGDYSLVIVLPNENNSSSDYVELLNAMESKMFANNNYDGMFTGYENKYVRVKIPKFKVETTLLLKDYLNEMGVRRIFNENADLHGIAKGDQLLVSKVLQKTFIDVNEKGTEAAAATGMIVAVRGTFLPPQSELFIADRPFLFFLLKSRELVLFSGRYEVPN